MKKLKAAGQKAKPTAPIDGGIAACGNPQSLQKVVRTEVALAKSHAEAVANAKKMLAHAIGVRDEELGALIIDQLNRLIVLWSPSDAGNALNLALTMMLEMKPETLMQALLAVQMVGVHYAAVSFLQRAAIPRQSSEGSEENMARAIKMMRVFNEQLEAMAKLKGKSGQQKVTVEHVHVYQGGQAIVGAVHAPKRDRGGRGSRESRTKTP